MHNELLHVGLCVLVVVQSHAAKVQSHPSLPFHRIERLLLLIQSEFVTFYQQTLLNTIFINTTKLMSIADYSIH